MLRSSSLIGIVRFLWARALGRFPTGLRTILDKAVDVLPSHSSSASHLMRQVFFFLIVSSQSFAWLVPAPTTPSPALPARLPVLTREVVLHKGSARESRVHINEVATRKELAGVVHLRAQVFYPFYCAGFFEWKNKTERDLKKKIEDKDSIILCANRNYGEIISRGNDFFGNVVGSVEFSGSVFDGSPMEFIQGKKVYVSDLCVRKDARGSGLGILLLTMIEEYASASNYDSVFLHVERKNLKAHQLYCRLGYSKVGLADWATLFTEHRLGKSEEVYHLMYKSMRLRRDEDLIKSAAIANHSEP